MMHDTPTSASGPILVEQRLSLLKDKKLRGACTRVAGNWIIGGGLLRCSEAAAATWADIS